MKNRLLLYIVCRVLGQTGQQCFPGKRGKRWRASEQIFFCILMSSPKIHPTDQTSIGLLYPFSSKITSGALYHLVVTLRVNFARGLCMLSIRFIFDYSEIDSSVFWTTFVFCLAKPFFFAFPSAAGFSAGCSTFSLLFEPVNFILSSSSSELSSISSSGGANSSMILARPKSQILTTSPWPLMRTLAGLRSRCTILAEWRYLSLNEKTYTRR